VSVPRRRRGYATCVPASDEKTDQHMIELLNELRVVLPGAQVLLGFLLTAPFATRFEQTSHFDRGLWFACMLFTTVGALTLMAPSIYHRMRWQDGVKEKAVEVGHQLFLAGTASLGVGMLCAVFLLGDVLFGPPAAILATAVVALVIVSTWYVLPIRQR
jgi:hypothetical protein